MRTSHRTGVSTFASRTSPSTDQSLQKSFHLSHVDKIELKKISSPSENKKYPTAQPDTTKTEKRSIDNGLQGRWTEGQLITAPTKNWRFSTSYDSFVVNQTFVLRMNICGKNRQLLVAANRYAATPVTSLKLGLPFDFLACFVSIEKLIAKGSYDE